MLVPECIKRSRSWPMTTNFQMVPPNNSVTVWPKGSDMAALQPVGKIWMDGEFVNWDDANVHVLTHGLHYGSGVFEGIRAYETERGTAIFRNRDHLDRLEASSKLYYMDL